MSGLFITIWWLRVLIGFQEVEKVQNQNDSFKPESRDDKFNITFTQEVNSEIEVQLTENLGLTVSVNTELENTVPKSVSLSVSTKWTNPFAGASNDTRASNSGQQWPALFRGKRSCYEISHEDNITQIENGQDTADFQDLKGSEYILYFVFTLLFLIIVIVYHLYKMDKLEEKRMSHQDNVSIV